MGSLNCKDCSSNDCVSSLLYIAKRRDLRQKIFHIYGGLVCKFVRRELIEEPTSTDTTVLMCTNERNVFICVDTRILGCECRNDRAANTVANVSYAEFTVITVVFRTQCLPLQYLLIFRAESGVDIVKTCLR